MVFHVALIPQLGAEQCFPTALAASDIVEADDLRGRFCNPTLMVNLKFQPNDDDSPVWSGN